MGTWRTSRSTRSRRGSSSPVRVRVCVMVVVVVVESLPFAGKAKGTRHTHHLTHVITLSGNWQEEGHEWIGRKVRRVYGADGGCADGKITAWLAPVSTCTRLIADTST